MEAVELRPVGAPTTAWTNGSWQRTQLTRTICRSRGVISMGSWKFCSVNAIEWRKPWSALAAYLARPRAGRWHSHAGRGVTVPALEPRVVLLVHDVAVDAGARIGREVREAFRVDEGEGADAGRNAQQASQHQYEAKRLHDGRRVRL